MNKCISIQKQPSCEKVCGPKTPGWKKLWNQRWGPRNGCNNSSIAKILNWSEFVCPLPSQPFLGHLLSFHIFFTLVFWDWTLFHRFYFFLWLHIHNAPNGWLWCFFICLFFTTGVIHYYKKDAAFNLTVFVWISLLL